MAYFAYVTTLQNLRPHPNADRLQLGDCFGNTVCVSMEYTEGQIGIYFPVDGQLSEEFAEKNNLIRHKDENGNNIGGYMSDKRNVTAIKLRGQKSDGLFLPISCLAYAGNTSKLQIGDAISVFNGHEICQKYIPKKNSRQNVSAGNRTRKKKVPMAPLFIEHVDTEQLAYHMSDFQPGDDVEITLKMHGSSQRTGHLPVFKGYKRSFWDKITHKEGTPIYDWGYVTGTRRTVLNEDSEGYYGSNEFRKVHSDFLEGKLWKNEEIFYEVVGYIDDRISIMPSGTVPNEYRQQYGKIMEFSYGMTAPNSDMYVYRMTMTSPDGEIVEYSPEFMRYRCKQIGVKCVPVLWRGRIPEDIDIPAGEWIKNIAERYYDGPDPIGKTHVREGVVCRIVNRPKFAGYKHKNWLFKYVSGIIVEKIADSDETYDADILSEM
jgi:RNA ligase (TIGR02306 family)